MNLPFRGRFFVLNESPDFFGLPFFFFFFRWTEPNPFPEKIASLFKRVRRYFQNNYLYRNAVKRSINTSCTPLITLINGSRLWLHSYVKKYKSTFFVIFPKVAVVSRKVADIPKVCGDCSNFMS